MRKIATPQELEKRKKRNGLIVATIMLGILVLGTAGFAFSFGFGGRSSSNNEQTSNTNAQSGHLGAVGDQWASVYQGQTLLFTNSPDNIRNISVDITHTLNNFAGNTLYIASENEAVASEVASTLGRFSQRIQEVCLGSCEEDLPEKDCSENLIVWRDGENKVYQEENCIFIEGDTRAADAFLYNLFGLS